MSASAQSAGSAPPSGVVLAIEGMHCDGCVRSVSRVLARVDGVEAAEVDLERGRAVVRGAADPAALVAAVQKAGFGAALAAG